MAETSKEDKTEAASPRRIEKAREEGQVPRSREMNTFVMLLAGIGGPDAVRRLLGGLPSTARGRVVAVEMPVGFGGTKPA